jgi:hypothetical protein
MSTDTDLILGKISNLSVSELLSVQDAITYELRQKLQADKGLLNKETRFSEPKRKIAIPGAYQPTAEEIEAELAESFTPEERAEMAKVDLSNLPPLPAGAKTSTQIISEDREDRF